MMKWRDVCGSSLPERGLHVEEADERGAPAAVGGGHGVCVQVAPGERATDASACMRRQQASALAPVQEAVVDERRRRSSTMGRSLLEGGVGMDSQDTRE